MSTETIALSIALIRKKDDQGLRWLGRLNPATDTLKFVMAFPAEKESFRESVTKEISWELGLDRKSDFLVSNMAQLNAEFPESLPAVTNGTPLKVSFYNVEIYRRPILAALIEDEQNFWLSSEEIWAGQMSDGTKRLDAMLHQMITKSEVIRSWESSY